MSCLRIFCLMSGLVLAVIVRAQSLPLSQGSEHPQGGPMPIEGVDLSRMGIIADTSVARLQQQLSTQIKAHNAALLKRFDKDKNGRLDSAETATMEKWLKTSRQRGPMQGGQPGGGPGGMPPGGGNAQMGSKPGGMSEANPSVKATAACLVDGQSSSKLSSSIITKEENQSALRVINAGSFSGQSLTIDKAAGNVTSEEESNFYGLNAAVACEKACKLMLSGGSIHSAAEGANAVFAFGKGAVAEVKDLTITTEQNASRGLDATYGGTVKGTNLSISTKGAHCADLATDRGEGFIIASACKGTTQGEGSPGIYSTGDITATDCQFEAFGSEAGVIEGKNTITLLRTSLTGHVKCGIMLYQSFSGDAASGVSRLKMTDSKLKAYAGPLFYCTNTQTSIELDNNELQGATSTLLEAAGQNRWGKTGANGAQVTLSASHQILSGDVIADKMSSLSLHFGEGTQFTGSVNKDNTASATSVSMTQGAKWTLTADSHVNKFSVEGATLAQVMKQIQSKGHSIYYGALASAGLSGKTYSLPGGGFLKPDR